MVVRWFFGFLISISSLSSCSPEVIVANDENVESILKDYELTLLTFSAEWCQFSQMLAPILDDAAKKLVDLSQSKKAALIKIDCPQNQNFCTKHNIRKYPTLKVTRHGIVMKREYRQGRNVDAIEKFIRDNTVDPVIKISGNKTKYDQALINITDSRNAIVGLFGPINSTNAHVWYFTRAASIERDFCSFYLVDDLDTDQERLAFREQLTDRFTAVTVLKNADFRAIHTWIVRHCHPVVREMTFQNAEEITEEGIPLLILFYHPNDKTVVTKFNKLVKDNLTSEHERVNFVTLDGREFSHPLSHLGKSEKDLPLLCIDSFAHMYMYPSSVDEAVSDPIHLKQFIDDLHSGKLHREYHYGPDKAIEAPKPTEAEPGSEDQRQPSDGTSPPPSIFRNLAPSRMRYTILHDEF